MCGGAGNPEILSVEIGTITGILSTVEYHSSSTLLRTGVWCTVATVVQ